MMCCGAIAGLLSLMLSKKFITARIQELPKNWLLNGKYAPIIWCVLGSIGFGIIQYFGNSVYEKAEYIIVFVICLCLSAVDFSIRKIPNSLLLALILSRILFLALNFTKEEMVQSLWGFGVACVIFTIPSLFKINVGAGDMKLAAITGLYLGINGFLQAMIVMALTIAIYGIYIIIRKLGNLKSKTAMGPYLAFGLISTLLFPLF